MTNPVADAAAELDREAVGLARRGAVDVDVSVSFEGVLGRGFDLPAQCIDIFETV